jgi:hypothetical protein
MQPYTLSHSHVRHPALETPPTPTIQLILTKGAVTLPPPLQPLHPLLPITHSSFPTGPAFSLSSFPTSPASHFSAPAPGSLACAPRRCARSSVSPHPPPSPVPYRTSRQLRDARRSADGILNNGLEARPRLTPFQLEVLTASQLFLLAPPPHCRCEATTPPAATGICQENRKR